MLFVVFVCVIVCLCAPLFASWRLCVYCFVRVHVSLFVRLIVVLLCCVVCCVVVAFCCVVAVLLLLLCWYGVRLVFCCLVDVMMC